MTTPFFEFVWLAAFEDSARDLFGEAERRAVELELLDDPRITAYAKSERSDLTPHDRAVIRALVTRLRKET